MERMRVMARPSLLDWADEMPNPLGVWVQVDTWDTHIFVLFGHCEDVDGGFSVVMYDARQDEKGRMAGEDDIVASMCSGAWETSTHASLSDALLTIADGFAIDFDPADPHGLAAAYGEAKLTNAAEEA